MKKIIILSDLHCGHIVGLTPPKWQVNMSEYYKEQKSCFNFFKTEIEKLGKIDVTIVNGDAIEGKGERSGGTELIVSDRKQQVEIAEECLSLINTKKIYFTYGTPSHVGKEEDWEKVLSDNMGGEIKNILSIQIDEIKFNIRHHIGSSTVPHGRFTPIARERVWDMLKEDYEGREKSDILIRSHVHYFTYCGDEKGLGITTPALQGKGSKYGGRVCSGTTSFGFIYMEVDGDKYSWKPIILDYRVINKNSFIKI